MATHRLHTSHAHTRTHAIHHAPTHISTDTTFNTHVQRNHTHNKYSPPSAYPCHQHTANTPSTIYTTPHTSQTGAAHHVRFKCHTAHMPRAQTYHTHCTPRNVKDFPYTCMHHTPHTPVTCNLNTHALHTHTAQTHVLPCGPLPSKGITGVKRRIRVPVQLTHSSASAPPSSVACPRPRTLPSGH